MKQTNIHQAKTHLSKLIEQALRGEDVVIARAGKPVVRLVRFVETTKPRRGGQWRGLARIGHDFDADLPADIAEAFGGKAP